MKIKSSAVAMSGTSSYSHYQESTVTSKRMRVSQWNALKQDVDKEAEENGVSMSVSEQSQAILQYSGTEGYESNEIGRFGLNDRSDLVYNEDGSFDILIQKERPKGKMGTIAEG